jgi:hypothetical protein
MIAAAIILTLIGALWLRPIGSYFQSPSGKVGSSEEAPDEEGKDSSEASSRASSLSEARSAFEQAVSSSYGDPNLEVVDVMEFANNFYAEVEESDTGIHAMELLIDKRSGRVHLELGPNMMWNTKYGMMGGQGMMGPNGQGMMGPGGQQGMMAPAGSPQVSPETEMPVSSEQATQIAEDYLNRVSPGTETEEPDQFYGYYTLHTVRDGEVTGMLSVNGYTGQVWYHSWHGPFIAMEEETE